jgi:homoserine kinase
MSAIKKILVSAPATTSNLGPAFDCLGLALGLRNELYAELHEGRGDPVVEISGEGAESLPRDSSNLIVKAARSLGDFPGRLVFRAVNRIPLARGLGSSAAAAVCGLFAGRALLGSPLSDDNLLQYAATLEGHPDNAAPAVLGGAILSIKNLGRFEFHRLKTHEDLAAVLCLPDFELATPKARAAVPRTTLLENAVDNIGRAMLLAMALGEGRFEALAVAMEDKLHQPYRAPLIPGFAAVLKAARQAGTCGVALSGAGPGILALTRRNDPDIEKIGEAMKKAFSDNGVKSRCLDLAVEPKGVEVRRI